MLASLLLNPGQPVSAETLIDRLWDEDPPPRARGNLHANIARLRKALVAATGRRCIEGGGKAGVYVLDVPRESIDRFRFERWRDEARAFADYGDDEQAVRLLRKAEELWRAEPLAGLPGDWASRVRMSLLELRAEVTTLRIEAELRLGRHATVVAELNALVAERPFDEKLIFHLMTALYQCGRAAEALEIYRGASHRKVAEFGAGLGTRVTDLHQRILNDDPELRVATGPQQTALFRPNNLPRDIPTFTGRDGEIQRQLASLPSGSPSPAAAVTVIAIDGMAGVGKTALAVHLAHRLTEDYPDAQLFLNLRAHDPEQPKLEPRAALDAALRGLGVPRPSIPTDLDDRIVVWRTQLARRRCVIVLDDAADHHQIRPLLPGAPGSVVLVTSRNRLADLEGVRSVSLDVLPETQAETLFARVVGPGRSLEPHDLRAVARFCGHLPLALELSGSRLKHRSAWALTDLVARLSTEERLDEIRAGDHWLTRDFALSYRELGSVQAAAFRRLGHHPGTDFTTDSAAALMALPLAEMERVIEELLSRHLLQEGAEGRYRYHDLLRDYARGLARREDAEGALRADLRRVLDHYLAVARRACMTCYPYQRYPESVASASAVAPTLDTPVRAAAWLTASRANIVDAVRSGREKGLDEQAALLSLVLWPYYEEAGYWEEAIGPLEDALRVWRRRSDRSLQADALRALAHARWCVNEEDEALKHAKEALALFRSLNERHGEAVIMDRIGLIHWARSDYRTSLAYGHAGLEIQRKIGDRHGEATSLMHGAITLTELGRYQQAQDDFEEALRIYQQIDDRRGMKWILINTGHLLLRRGDPADALRCFRQAADAVVELSRHENAILLGNIGAVHAYEGRHEEALENFRLALAIHREMGDRRQEADILLTMGRVSIDTGDIREGLALYRKVISMARKLSDLRLQMGARLGVGEVHLLNKVSTLALEEYQACWELARKVKSPYGEAQALEGIGNVFLQVQNLDRSRDHFERALRRYEALGVPDAMRVRHRIQGMGDAAGY